MDSYCKSQKRADHATLRELAKAMRDTVLAVDTLPPAKTASNRYETELVLVDGEDTVPPGLLREIADCSLGIAQVQPQGGFLQVVVR